MRIRVLLTCSTVARIGLDIAARNGVTLLARARGRCILVYHGGENLVFVTPARVPSSDVGPASLG